MADTTGTTTPAADGKTTGRRLLLGIVTRDKGAAT